MGVVQQNDAVSAAWREELSHAVIAASRLTGTPVAFASLVTDVGESVVAGVGWNAAHFPPERSLASLIGAEGSLVVVNAVEDERLKHHPLVASAPHVRFVAGYRIISTADAAAVLYVLDRQPRVPSPEQIEALRWLVAKLESGWQSAEALASAEERAAESEERFADLFAASDDLILTVDPRGTVLHCNAAAATVWSPDAKGNGASIFQPIAPEARSAFEAAFHRIMKSGKVETVETVVATDQGRVTVEGPFRPKVAAGRVVLARACFRDITDRKDLENALGAARDSALEASRLKSQFLSNISHEVRTPMNGITGMLDLLQSTELTMEQHEYINVARSSSEQLLAMIDNLLHVSQIEAGPVASLTSEIDLHGMLTRIVEVMRIAALGKSFELEFEYDRRIPLILRGDAPRVRQIVTNLLNNAVKFTDEGEVRLSVTLEKETGTHHLVRFAVSDTGTGIAAEDRDRLFRPFSQLDASMTRTHEGIGIGLVTAKMLTEMLGGVIDCESTPGSGSTFWFTIPFVRADVHSRKLHRQLEGMRALVIDQSPASLKLIGYHLTTGWKMRMSTAETGTEGLDELRRAAAEGDPYRLVIFDRLSDIDPTEFARTIKSEDAIAATGLILVLSSGDRADDTLLRAAGIAARTTRPVGRSELLECITTSLGGKMLAAASSLPTPAPSVPPPPLRPDQRERLRVIVVEDNLLNLKLTLTQLNKLGFTADSATNGVEALEKLKQSRYDVMLLDCQMPQLDGYETAMEIRRREGGARSLHIIALTAHALEADRERCLASGMDDYLPKPTVASQLDLALARAVRHDG